MFTFLLRAYTVPPRSENRMLSPQILTSRLAGGGGGPIFHPPASASPLAECVAARRACDVRAHTNELYGRDRRAALLFNQTYFKKYGFICKSKIFSTHDTRISNATCVTSFSSRYRIVCNTMLTPRACRSELPVSTVAVTRHWKRWNWAACTTFSP